MRIQTWVVTMGLLSLAGTAGAEVKSISVAAGGVLWLTCVYRLEKAIQRLDGVARVKVQMEPTRAEVTPRGGTWIEADRLRGAIKNAGFKPGAVRCTLVGTLAQWQGQPALHLAGSERLVALRADTSAAAVYERAQRAVTESAGKPVEVEGELMDRPAAAEKTAPAALRLRRLEIGG